MLLPRLSGGATRSSTLDPISGRRRQAPEGWRGRRPTRGSRSSRYPSRIRSTPGRDYHQGFPSPAHPLRRRQTAEESRCASPSLVIRLHFSAALSFAVTSVVNWINCTMLKPWGSGLPSARATATDPKPPIIACREISIPFRSSPSPLSRRNHVFRFVGF